MPTGRARALTTFTVVGLLALASAVAAGQAATVGGLHGAATVTVKLKPAWAVRAKSQLALSTGRMRCVVRGLTRSGKRPATAATLSCTGPGGSPGLRYPLTVSVRGRRGAVVRTAVRFPRPRFATLAAFLAAAPLPPLGTEIVVNHEDFYVPTGWTRVDGAGYTKLTGTDGSNTCDVYVLDAVTPDTTNGATSELAQLHDLLVNLNGGQPIYGENGADDPYATRITATTGLGQPVVGLIATLTDRSTEIRGTLTTFASDFAVPMVRVGGSCMRGWQFDAGASEVEVTMSRDTATPVSLAAYENALLGEWTGGSGSAGALYAYAANGHYTWAFSKNGIVQSGGSLYDVYLEWAGDGNYVLLGPFLAHFPVASTAGASTEIISIWTEQRPGGLTITWLCSLEQLTTLSRVCVGRS